MEEDPTPLDVSRGESAYSKLRGKLGQLNDAVMARKVDEVLAR